ncbi:MAG TPA: hypothetical protein VFB12_10120 [Ktedonobacteraceae bacterium]|nr:hypothetical protein [Ktedonobacteraceae bacterium]
MKATTRTAIVEWLNGKRGCSEETETLIDRVWDMWETIDLLVEAFGQDRAQKVVHVPSSLPVREVQKMQKGSSV